MTVILPHDKNLVLETHLTSLSQNFWAIHCPQRFFGLEIGTRMTIIRLKSGELFLHSPVHLTNNIQKKLNTLGKVRYVIAPNKFHHLYVGEYFNAFPDAEIYAAPGLERKRADLSFHGVLTNETANGWQEDIVHLVFGGMPLINEVVFLHRESLTLILTDLIFNFGSDLPLSTKIFLKLDGVFNSFSVPRLIRYLLIKDREKARESISKILSWDFERVIVAHGNILETGGKEAVNKAFNWL
ncbi:MAG: DUF4336 domain-containing protein [Thermodesulfobacteriota bacterium]